MVHLAGSLLNTGAIENAKGAFYLFGQGLSPSVLRCMRAIYEEKLALFEKLSYRDRFNWNFLERIMNPGEYPGYFERYRLEDYLDNSLYKRTVERLFEERKPVYHDHIR